MATAPAKTVVGLSVETIEPTFGAPVTFFKLGRVNVDFVGGTTQIAFRGFATEAASNTARTPLTYPAVDVVGVPTGEPLDWCYRAVVAATNHALVGATLVERTQAEIDAAKPPVEGEPGEP